jgi:hypothetical protein
MNDVSGIGIEGLMDCPVCGEELPAAAAAGRRRRYCSASCRQRAYRARHPGGGPDRDGRREPGNAEAAGPVVAAIVVFPAPSDAAGAAHPGSAAVLDALLAGLTRLHAAPWAQARVPARERCPRPRDRDAADRETSRDDDPGRQPENSS